MKNAEIVEVLNSLNILNKEQFITGNEVQRDTKKLKRLRKKLINEIEVNL